MVNLFKGWFGRMKERAATVERLKAPLQELPGGQDQWFQDSMDWFVEQFGRDALTRPIVRPSKFVPAGYDGSEAAARALFEQIRERMGVPAGRLVVRFDLDAVDGRLDRQHGRPTPQIGSGTRMNFGCWLRGKEHNTIFVSERLLDEPIVLVAIMAHELGHEVLLGSGLVKPSRPDQESLTDLLAVFHGFGIFLANASFGRPPGGPRNLRMGMSYLRERALTDALAYYLSLQGITEPPSWAAAELDWPVQVGVAVRLHELEEAAQPSK